MSLRYRLLICLVCLSATGPTTLGACLDFDFEGFPCRTSGNDCPTGYECREVEWDPSQTKDNGGRERPSPMCCHTGAKVCCTRDRLCFSFETSVSPGAGCNNDNDCFAADKKERGEVCRSLDYFGPSVKLCCREGAVWCCDSLGICYDMENGGVTVSNGSLPPSPPDSGAGFDFP